MAISTEDRTIQFFGIIRPFYNPESIVKWWRLTADIIRPQTSQYINAKFPNPETFYGYVQYIYANRVFRTDTFRYDNQILAFAYNTGAFLHAAVSCSLEAILTSFENQNNGLGLVNISRNNPIKSWNQLFIYPEEIRIRMLSPNNVARFIFEYDVVDNCAVDNSPNPSPEPTPEPPEPQTPTEPETPDSQLPPISEAYEPPDDGGFTYNPEPPDLGEPGEGNNTPPIGSNCTIYSVTATVIVNEDPGNTITSSGLYYGPIQDVFVENNDVRIICRGSAGITGQDSECQPGLVNRGGLITGGTDTITLVNVVVE